MAKQIATNVTWHDGEISRDDRYQILRQKGATIWFTGLSGSGNHDRRGTREGDAFVR